MLAIAAIIILKPLFLDTPTKLIVGKWGLEGSDHYIEFTESGSVLASAGNDGLTVHYSVQDGNRLQLDVQVLWGHGTAMADFEISREELTLFNISDPDDLFHFPESITFIRVK